MRAIDSLVAKRQPSSYGRYKVFISSSGRVQVAIGPHWYISFLAWAFLAGMGPLLLSALRPHLSPLMSGVYLLFWTVCILSYLVIIIADPGIVPKLEARPEEDVEGGAAADMVKCVPCNTWSKKEAMGHCASCEVCIEGYDHHCPWIGKCVGKKNLIIFYVFVATIPLLYAFVLFCGITITFSTVNFVG